MAQRLFPPGSFTKNLGGYEKLHKGLRTGFKPGINISDLRSAMEQVMASDQALLISEYFLATRIAGDEEVIFYDSLIQESMRREDYSPTLARLYLFSIIMNNPGERLRDAHKSPAGAQNYYVTKYLYQQRGWVWERLDKEQHIRPLLENILQAEKTTITKFTTNLYHFFEQCKFSKDKDGYVNTYAEYWGPAAIRLFFERFEIMHGASKVEDLVEAAFQHELHKLLGVPRKWLDDLIEGAADAYLAGRHEQFFAAEEEPDSVTYDEPLRETRQVSNFKRTAENRALLRHWYKGDCQICGCALEGHKGISFDAAHIYPLRGGGPDTTANMLSLCPNHHRQFDLGAIGIDPNTLEILAPFGSTPIVLKTLARNNKHEIGQQFLIHHYRNIFKGSN